MNKFQKYDYCRLRKVFPSMKTNEIVAEYINVSRQRKQLLECTDFEEFLDKIEPLDNAFDFLGHYLAETFCHACGMNIYD